MNQICKIGCYIFSCILMMTSLGCSGSQKVLQKKHFQFDEMQVDVVTSQLNNAWSEHNGMVISDPTFKSNGITIDNVAFSNQVSPDFGVRIRNGFIYFPNKKQIIVAADSARSDSLLVAINTTGEPRATPIAGALNFDGDKKPLFLGKDDFQYLKNEGRFGGLSLAGGIYFDDLKTSLHSGAGADNLVVDYVDENIHVLNGYVQDELQRQQQKNMPRPMTSRDDFNYTYKFNGPMLLGYSQNRRYIRTAYIQKVNDLVWTCIEEMTGSDFACALLKINGVGRFADQVVNEEFARNHTRFDFTHPKEFMIDGRFSSYDGVVALSNANQAAQELAKIIEAQVTLEPKGQKWRQIIAKDATVLSQFTKDVWFEPPFSGVNHQKRSIFKFYIDDEEQANLWDYQKRGDTGCCFRLPEQWRKGLSVKVRWLLTYPENHIGEAMWHEQVVSVPAYTKDSKYALVHFFEKDTVAIEFVSNKEAASQYPEPVENDGWRRLDKTRIEWIEEYCQSVRLSNMTQAQCQSEVKKYDEQQNKNP